MYSFDVCCQTTDSDNAFILLMFHEGNQQTNFFEVYINCSIFHHPITVY